MIGRDVTFVQAVGDGSSIIAEHAHLTLTRRIKQRTINSELDYLNPYSMGVPCIGRTAELAKFWNWLHRPRTISIAVMIGPPGSGKTRLALELIEKAAAEHWDTGLWMAVESGAYSAASVE